MCIRRLVLSAVITVAVAAPLWSQQSNEPGNESSFRAASPTTFALVQIDPNRMAVPDWIGDGQAAVIGQRVVDLVKNAAGESRFFMTADIPYGASQPVVRFLVPATTPDATSKAKALLTNASISEPVVRDGFVIASPTDNIPNAPVGIDESVLAVDRIRYAAAASAVAKFPIQILVVPPAHVWETYEELLPELPNKLGGGQTSIVTKGLNWAAIGVNLEDATLSATIKSTDADAAQAFAKRLPNLLDRMLDQVPSHSSIATMRTPIRAILKLAKISVVDDRIQVAFDGEAGTTPQKILSAILSKTGGPIAANRKRNRMRQLVLGVINYESANATFPPNKNLRRNDGAKGLSWRVQILPYIEEVELYQRFRLNEPWDSPHNIKLLDEMPDVFSAYTNTGLTDPVLKPGHTTFVAPTGDGTILGGSDVVKIRHITDGTSKTVLLVEVKPENAVPWTAPQDYAYSPDDPGAGLAWDQTDKVAVAFCDGSFRALPKSTSKEMLRRLFIMNDGRAIRLE